jgi:short-subunit dehydrogenase
MRDAAEATILITGATDGLGKHAASALASRGVTVLLHGRSSERLEATLEDLRGQTNSQKVGSYLADLSSLAAVRDLADRVLSEYDRLDVEKLGPKRLFTLVRGRGFLRR